MGMEAHLTFYADSELQAKRAAQATFARIERLDQTFSDYRASSEASQLEVGAVDHPQKVSPAMWLVLTESQRLFRATDGAFDITAGPLVVLWREARKTGNIPKVDALQQAREISGMNLIQLKPGDQTMQILKPGVQLDFGGIAKGFACDEAIKTLSRHGITSASVVIGGDLKVSNPPPGQTGWRIQILGEKEPRTLSNIAVSTSGDTEQFVVIEGHRYSHVVDPRTGFAVTDSIQATVMASEGLLTDPLATALCVDGEEGLSYAKKLGATVIIH